MRPAIQILRDVAEAYCQQSVEFGDKDLADAWERIGIRLADVDRLIASDWATIQARAPRDSRGVLSVVSQSMHNAVCGKSETT